MRTGSRPSEPPRPAHAALVVSALFVVACIGLWTVLGDRDAPSADAATSRATATSVVVTQPPDTSAVTTSPTPSDTPAPTNSTPATAPASSVTSAPVTDAPQVTNPTVDQGGYTPPTQDASGSQGGQSSGTPDVTGSTPLTTTQDLLVGPPPSSTTTTTVVRQDLSTTAVTHKGGSSDPKVWLVVAGLVLVAVLLGVVTALYWRRTSPALQTSDGLDDGAGSGGRGRRRQGGSRYSDLVITVPKSS